MAETPVWRPTARMFVVDPDERVLLFSSAEESGRTWWFTPGGGMYRGETPAAAAFRELAEETGYACTEAEIGPVVATTAGTWTGDDGRLFFGADSFFFVRVPHPDIDTDGQEEFERSFITGHRWWTIDELRTATDEISPMGLADLVAGLVAGLMGGDASARPVRLPWGWLRG